MHHHPLPYPAQPCFLLNNAGVWDANERDLKTGFIFTYAHMALIMQIHLKGFSFTVMENFYCFGKALTLREFWAPNNL